MPYGKSGKLKALAVTSPQRDPALPDVPTLAESGLPGYDVGSWYGLLAPAGTPPAVVTKISAAVAEIVRDPETRRKMLELGATPVGGTPEQFNDHIHREIEKWAGGVKSSGAQEIGRAND